MKRNNVIWTEDDATSHDPDHEDLEKAWKTMIGLLL